MKAERDKFLTPDQFRRLLAAAAGEERSEFVTIDPASGELVRLLFERQARDAWHRAGKRVPHSGT